MPEPALVICSETGVIAPSIGREEVVSQFLQRAMIGSSYVFTVLDSSSEAVSHYSTCCCECCHGQNSLTVFMDSVVELSQQTWMVLSALKQQHCPCLIYAGVQQYSSRQVQFQPNQMGWICSSADLLPARVRRHCSPSAAHWRRHCGDVRRM